MAARQAVLGMDRGGFFYGTTRVFTDVSFIDDARTALVGENGAGNIDPAQVPGELELDRGQLVKSRGLRVGALPVELEGLDELSVRAVLTRLAKVGAWSTAKRIEALADEIGSARCWSSRSAPPAGGSG